jgi:hypothetical protein
MNKKGSATKLLILLVIVVVSSLVVSLFSLNVLYWISKSNSLLGGELASFSSQGSSCDGNSDCPSTACFDSTRLFSVACISDRCDYGHKIADCSNGCSNGACISSTSTSSSSTSTSSGGVVGTMSQTCINTCDYYGYKSQKCLDCQKTSSITLTSTSDETPYNPEILTWKEKCNKCLTNAAIASENALVAAREHAQTLNTVYYEEYQNCLRIAEEEEEVSVNTCTFIYNYQANKVNKDYEAEKLRINNKFKEALDYCNKEFCDKVYT